MTVNRYCPTCRATTRWTDHGDRLTCEVCGRVVVRVVVRDLSPDEGAS